MFYSLIAYKASKIIKIRKEQVEKKELTKKVPKNISITKGTYETDIDIFYKLVEQHGPITISAIAKHFKMSKKKIEEWADILEEEEMIRIHYPPVGDAELTKW
jgi:predicted transcriptional regulator